VKTACIRAAEQASAAINERPVIASEARQSMASGLHGLPRRCAPRNDRTYVAIGRGNQIDKREACPF